MIEDKIRKFYEALTAMVAAIQEVSYGQLSLVGWKNICTAVRAGQARFRPIKSSFKIFSTNKRFCYVLGRGCGRVESLVESKVESRVTSINANDKRDNETGNKIEVLNSTLTSLTHDCVLLEIESY